MPSNDPSFRALIARLPVDPDLDWEIPPLRRVHATALVAVGGIAGSGLRAAVAALVPVSQYGWPAATLIVNVVGSLLLGALLTAVHERYADTHWVRPLLGTGFCGGFSTFSTVTLEFAVRTGTGRTASAAAYVAISVIASLLACVVGVLGTRAATRLLDRPGWQRRLRHAQRLANQEET